MRKKRTSVVHRICTLVGSLFCFILIPLLLINCTLIIKSITNKNEVPDIGGIFPMVILTDSMNPQLASGDLVICRKINAKNIKTGDVICFYDPEGNGTATVTHRVPEIITDETGALAWITKGDANNTEDEKPVRSENLAGIYCWRLPGLGNTAMFMQSTKGILLCVVCPLLLMAAYDKSCDLRQKKEKEKSTEALLAELDVLRAEREEKSGLKGECKL